MSPLDYLFSETRAPELITLRRARVFAMVNIPGPSVAGVPVGNTLLFSGRQNLSDWALYRHVGDDLEIVSPFGACRLPTIGLDVNKPIGLASSNCQARSRCWSIQFDFQWRNARGEAAKEDWLKAKPLLDGSFEPLCSSVCFRGEQGLRVWTIVLLPSPAERIFAKGGQARIKAGGRLFSIPPGRASQDVLAGRVQWGLPERSVFFKLQELPFDMRRFRRRQKGFFSILWAQLKAVLRL